MSVHHYHRLCCKYHGRVVRITDRTGNVHFGRIIKVTPSHVFIQPAYRPRLGGLGYGFYGYPRYRYGYRPYPIAFSFITGLILGGLFF